MPEPSFILHGAKIPQSPIILSVPHAGRYYPDALLQTSRLPFATLELLEDRYVDLLAHKVILHGHSALIAHHARAWIDLNRGEREIDPDMLSTRLRSHNLIQSEKVIGGLGLIPRRLRGHGDILRGKIDISDLEQRLDQQYRPYHAQLLQTIRLAHQQFGVAIVIDLHSMPPITPQPAAQIIIGDRFGQSSANRYSAAARIAAQSAGYHVAENIPYAGGHILTCTGRPRANIHAIQVEVDRSLYLEPDLRTPRRDLGGMAEVVADIVEAILAEAKGVVIAAE